MDKNDIFATEPSRWPTQSYATVYWHQFTKQTACICLSISLKLIRLLLYVLMTAICFLVTLWALHPDRLPVCLSGCPVPPIFSKQESSRNF